MATVGPNLELRALSRYVSELEAHFIKPYLIAPTLAPPKRDEILQVAAYVVLVHGALENFIEGLALWVIDRAVTNWQFKKRATRCTSSILLYQKAPQLNPDAHTAIFDGIRLSLDEAKQQQSTAIRDNNGVTIRHVRDLFYKLGIDVPNDPTLAASIEMIVSMRHYWAHQYRFGAKVIKSAQDAKLAVGDCLTFAQRLSQEAISAKP